MKSMVHYYHIQNNKFWTMHINEKKPFSYSVLTLTSYKMESLNSKTDKCQFQSF